MLHSWLQQYTVDYRVTQGGGGWFAYINGHFRVHFDVSILDSLCQCLIDMRILFISLKNFLDVSLLDNVTETG